MTGIISGLFTLMLGCASMGGLNANQDTVYKPDPSNAMYLEARLAMAGGYTEEARQLLERVRHNGDASEHVFSSLAEIYISENNLEEARKVIDEGIEIHPASVRIMKLQARRQRLEGDLDGSIATLETASALHPMRGDLLEDLSDLHMARLRRARTTEAIQVEVEALIRVYERLLETRSGYSRLPVLMVLSRFYMRQGMAEKALPVAGEAVELSPREVVTYQELGAAQTALGYTNDAMTTYRRALILEPANEEIKEAIAKLFSGDNSADELTGFYLDLAREFPTNLELQQQVLRVLFANERLIEAEQLLRTMMELWPEDVTNSVTLAHVTARNGNPKEALAIATDLIGENQLSADAALLIANAILAQDDLGSAVELLTSWLAGNPGELKVVALLSHLYIETGEKDKAIALLREFNANNNDNLLTTVWVVELLREIERFDQAHEVLDAVSEPLLAKHEADFKTMRANLYISEASGLQTQGRIAEAETLYRKAVEVDPSYDEAYNSLGYFYAQTNQKLDEALVLVRKALEISPEAGHIIDSLGWVLYHMGDYTGAIRELKTAANLSQPDASAAEIWDHLGDAYLRSGDRSKARESWKHALELDADGKFIEPEKLAEKIEKSQSSISTNQ